MKKRIIRFTAKVMLIVLSLQLVLPATSSYALTTGPSQPEVQSFEPVGTTEMVDIFSGDFVYNIPLMDIEGYPINIAYHSGINIEQEASWVGLGWNINPGEINRAVRGLPDDFNGDKVVKKLHIKDEKDYRLALGANAGFEFLGALNLGVSAEQFISYNNYKGIGVGTNFGAQLSVPVVNTGLGVNMGVSSMDGATIDAFISQRFSTSSNNDGNYGTVSFSASTGFNTRSGLKNISYSASAGVENSTLLAQKQDNNKHQQNAYSHGEMGGIGFGSFVPIGMQNYVPVVTNASKLESFSVRLKLGVEALYAYPHVNTSLSWSKLSYEADGTRPTFGYLYAQNAGDDAVMDFSREKDGVYNSTLPNLPLSGMTYDVYCISGQGTGGMFRPFRNDIGSVFDPEMSSTTSTRSVELELGTGVGVGGLFELGTDISVYNNEIKSGPWYRKTFRSNSKGSLFENVCFRQAGELTHSLQQDDAALSTADAVYVTESNQVRNKTGNSLGTLHNIYGATSQNRSSRANLLTFLTNEEAMVPAVCINSQLENYPQNSFVNNNNNSHIVISGKNRTGSYANKAKAHHIGEMTQTLPDGRRFVYGLPAMSNVQKEVTFSVNGSDANKSTGLVRYAVSPDESVSNNKGRDKYYQATYTPAYAHSYLLTSVFSADYVDITGDGATEDDLGAYTKFNYTMTDGDFRWVAPFQASQDSAQYNPGFWSDEGDDKGNYVSGSKEMWYLHSIETKNYVAEFYTSSRNDAKGILRKIVNAGDVESGTFESGLLNPKSGSSLSYKLDSIKLYNKNDRIVNGSSATPIKTVVFAYDYSLCPGVPNGTSGGGKLTLKRIYFKYGNSSKSLLNPYVFNYSDQNKPYKFSDKDRWGNYKPNNAALNNYEFPYVNQVKTDADANASNWHLTEIMLPSGGRLKVNYESDDYSFVQDKRAMEMFPIAGVGNSTTYQPRDILYQDIDNPYQYVYFHRDKNRELDNKSLRENYLEGQDLVYFSFNTDIAARNSYEYVKGYAKVEEVGYCGNDTGSDYGYVKLKAESAGLKSDKMLNPVTLAGLNTGRYYLPHIIYPGYNSTGDPDAMEVLRGLVGSTKELLTIWQNANVRFVKNGLCRQIKPGKSWLRLHSPGYTKLGGGTRVKSLLLEDAWDEMASNGSKATYGRNYAYTTKVDNGYQISSGVASYEPMIGADENPLRQPVKFTADAGRLMPAVECYQEEPFGESFYPSPSVGYSKVTVTSINKDIARSAKAEDVYEFYTAKDFPIETDYTTKNIPVNVRHSTLTNREIELNVLQGYSIRMNDMHGKPKSVSNYALKNSVTEPNKELITATRYNYQTVNGKLDNKVRAVRRTSLLSPGYEIATMPLGEETDFTLDNRSREMHSQSINVTMNLNVVSFGPIVVPIPTVFFPDKDERNIFKTQVATKIIQQYGILKSVEVIDHGARTVTNNVLYDSETGSVLLTKVNNEFNDTLNSLSYPAYWAYDNMGSSYFNTGYEEVIDSLYVDDDAKGYLTTVSSKRSYNLGDELWLQATENNVVKNYKVWITGMARPKLPPGPGPGPGIPDGGGTPITGYPGCYGTEVPVVEPRALFPAGNGVPWRAAWSSLKNVRIKVLRSGRRNQLGSSIQNLVFTGVYNPASIADLLSHTTMNTGMLSASMNTFSEEAGNVDFASAEAYHFNSYILGLVGNFRPQSGYSWLGPRKYSNKHSRKDGVFETYATQWSRGTTSFDSSSCSFMDYIMYLPNTNTGGWKLLKTVTKYSAYGLPQEEQDAAGIYSSALYGFNQSLPVAVGSNIPQKRLRYFGFEDVLLAQHSNRSLLGIFEILAPVSLPSVAKYYSGSSYGIPAATNFGLNTEITSAESHTGKYSLHFTGAGNLQLANLKNFKYPDIDYCYISIWVKPPSGLPSTSQIQLLALQTVSGPGATQNFTAFSRKTNTIDGWYKLEGKLDMSLLTNYDVLKLTLPAGYYLDDVRLYPDNGNMKSFAYDGLTMRLMAELDENNFATFYEYDQEGSLVRVKKESDRGILTVNENRRSNAKKMP